MDRAKYAEAELVQNRASVLLAGGTPAERRVWAEEAAARRGRSLTVVKSVDALPEALRLKDGVVLIEDVLVLGEAAQQQLVLCLQTQEERPKLLVAMAQGAEAVFGGDKLRPDLHYALRLAQVNFEEPGLRAAILARRAAPAAPTVQPARRAPAQRPAPSRRPLPAPKQRKPHKPRSGAAKRSRR